MSDNNASISSLTQPAKSVSVSQSTTSAKVKFYFESSRYSKVLTSAGKVELVNGRAVYEVDSDVDLVKECSMLLGLVVRKATEEDITKAVSVVTGNIHMGVATSETKLPASSNAGAAIISA